MKIKQPCLFTFALGMLFTLLLFVFFDSFWNDGGSQLPSSSESPQDAGTLSEQTPSQEVIALQKQIAQLEAELKNNEEFITASQQDEDRIHFQVFPGWTSVQIRDALLAVGILTDGDAFDAIIYTNDLQHRLKAGTYQFHVSMTPEKVVAQLTGKIEQNDKN
ncbi:MltG/YceG/YrrL family protein [Rubeoparvulum massiliense]|uniref:hypothetical protein n=1 Tax=Rubeoparvulum massiliense TaxID=1631346 RepID=UPI00065DD1A2|nr:hypothetical protein [Rubeoparvulum massiliense]